MIFTIFKETLIATTKRFFGGLFSIMSLKILFEIMAFMISIGLCVVICLNVENIIGVIMGLLTGLCVFIYLINFIDLFEKNWNDRYKR